MKESSGSVTHRNPNWVHKSWSCNVLDFSPEELEVFFSAEVTPRLQQFLHSTPQHCNLAMFELLYGICSRRIGTVYCAPIRYWNIQMVMYTVQIHPPHINADLANCVTPSTPSTRNYSLTWTVFSLVGVAATISICFVDWCVCVCDVYFPLHFHPPALFA